MINERIIVPMAWTTVTPNTGWDFTVGGAGPAQYARDVNGKVQLRGALRWTTGAAPAAFYLPAGMRPSVNRGFVAATNAISGPLTCWVGSDGSVSLGGNPTNTGTYCFDAVGFPAEQ